MGSGQGGRMVRRGTVARLLLTTLVVAGCASDDPGPASDGTGSQGALATPTETPTAGGTRSAGPTTTPRVPVAGAAWERLTDAPVGLTEVAATAHAGSLWVAGGFTADGSASAGVLRLAPADDRWTDGPPLPAGVHHAVLVSADGELYLLGGFSGASFEQPTAEVWVLNETAGRWDPAPALPEPRGGGAAAWDGRRLLFAGGVGPRGVAADVYALADGEWRRIGALREPREHLGATSDGEGRTWFLGGRQSANLETNVGTVEMASGSRIEPIANLLTPRSGVGAFWLPSAGACLVGGETAPGTVPLVECVTDDGAVVALPSLAVARHGLGVGRFEDGVYAVMGGELPGVFVSPVVERLPLD